MSVCDENKQTCTKRNIRWTSKVADEGYKLTFVYALDIIMILSSIL